MIDAIAGVDDRYDGVDAIVHLAAIPAPGLATTPRPSQQHASHVQRVPGRAAAGHHATSCRPRARPCSACRSTRRRRTSPSTRSTRPRPESTYSLVKQLEEQMAIQFCRWDPERSIIGLRFSNVMDPADYAAFPVVRRRPEAAQVEPVGLHRRARRRAGGPPGARASTAPGFERFIIANADTVMSRPNAELVAEVSRTSRPRDARAARHAALHRQGPPRARLRAAHTWRDVFTADL